MEMQSPELQSNLRFVRVSEDLYLEESISRNACKRNCINGLGDVFDKVIRKANINDSFYMDSVIVFHCLRNHMFPKE